MKMRILSPHIATRLVRPALLLLVASMLANRPLRAQTGAQASDELSSLSLAVLEKRAQGGNPAAQAELGARYEHGRSGVAQDDARALSFYLMAANQGLSKAQNQVGLFYEQGIGVPQDAVMARLWLRKGADQKDAAAEFNLARLYERGEGGPSDNEQALIWYQKSAEQGYALAQYSLGLRYMQGLVVPKNKDTARLWLQKAAAQGNPDAKSLLALLPASAGQPARAAASPATGGSSSDPVQQALDMLTGTPSTPAGNAATAPAATQATGADPVAQALSMLMQQNPQTQTPAPIVRPNQMASNTSGSSGMGSSNPPHTAPMRSAARSSSVPKETPPVLLPMGTYTGELTGYAVPPTEALPEPAGGRDKNAQRAVRSCNTPLKKDNLITRQNQANVCLTAAQYFQAQQDASATKSAYQKSCAYGNPQACIGFGNYLSSIDETKSALYVWNYGVGCNYNQQCTETIFQYYATVSPSDKDVLDFYGHDLCVSKLEMGICKTLSDAGLPIDYAAIEQRKKENEIADLKTRINALEDEAKSDDVGAAASQAASDHGSSLFGGGMFGTVASWGAGKGAQSQANDAAKARAQAAQLRAQLVQLQGNDAGAEAKGPSLLAAAITGVSAGASAASAAGANAVTVTAAGMQAGISYAAPPPPPPEQPRGGGGDAPPSGPAANVNVSFGQALSASVSTQPQATGPAEAPQTLTYNISFTGQGTAHVISSPPGINCPGVCSFTWPANPAQQLVLTSMNAPGIHSSLECAGTTSPAPGRAYNCNMGQMSGGVINLTIKLWPDGGTPSK